MICTLSCQLKVLELLEHPGHGTNMHYMSLHCFTNLPLTTSHFVIYIQISILQMVECSTAHQLEASLVAAREIPITFSAFF